MFGRPRHDENGFQIIILEIGRPFLHPLLQHVVCKLQRLVQEAHFQHVVNPRQHLGQRKRLADEVLGAGLEGAQLLSRLRADDQHRKVAVRCNFLESLHDLESIHAGHHQVQQDEVVRVLAV